MGAIVQWDEVVNKYRDAGSSGDDATMDAAYILPAEAYVRGMLYSRYSNPFLSAGELVKDLVVDETYRRICLTKAPKRADALKKDLDSRLKDIISGRVSLFDADGNAVERDMSNLWSSTEDYVPTFGVGDIVDMQVDHDQVDDEEDARG